MKATYVPGRGYTIRNPRGIVFAHSLTKSQCDAVLARCKDLGVISNALLAHVIGVS